MIQVISGIYFLIGGYFSSYYMNENNLKPITSSDSIGTICGKLFGLLITGILWPILLLKTLK